MPDAGRTHGPPATKKAGGSHHRFSQNTGIPCAMVLRLIRALLGVPGFLATVAGGSSSADLIPASGSVGGSGPHDFVVREDAFVRAAFAALNILTSIASRAQRFVTIA